MNYRLLIDYEVIEFLETLSRREQEELADKYIKLIGISTPWC